MGLTIIAVELNSGAGLVGQSADVLPSSSYDEADGEPRDLHLATPTTQLGNLELAVAASEESTTAAAAAANHIAAEEGSGVGEGLLHGGTRAREEALAVEDILHHLPGSPDILGLASDMQWLVDSALRVHVLQLRLNAELLL